MAQQEEEEEEEEQVVGLSAERLEVELAGEHSKSESEEQFVFSKWR